MTAGSVAGQWGFLNEPIHTEPIHTELPADLAQVPWRDNAYLAFWDRT